MFQAANRPLIIQGDSTILLDVHAPGAEEAREAIVPFTELEKSPEHVHTYRISNLSLWNAASAGFSAENILERLRSHSRYDPPSHLFQKLEETILRFGKVKLEAGDPLLKLRILDPKIKKELELRKQMKDLLIPSSEENTFHIHPIQRGSIKQAMIEIGYPVEDTIPLLDGDPLEVVIKNESENSKSFALRDYQKEAISAFAPHGGPGTGYGTIVLPCGAGKTIVGIGSMAEVQQKTLILTPNITAVHQWKRELLDKTELKEEQIAFYTGQEKKIADVTIATYQILTWRPNEESDFPHFGIFASQNWGLIIYDEVHLLPAPVFRITADIQAKRRLGLTATLVREDNLEHHVFSLVGPKRYDVPWRILEEQGWISTAECYELRIDLPEELEIEYAAADKRKKFRIASENPLKIPVIKQLIEQFHQESVLVIGQYIDQLEKIAQTLELPLITGKTVQEKREELFQAFRNKDIPCLVVSKVANFAVDLPDASVAIQISGSFGSRQEEAQRLGRILRPKDGPARFYSLISRFTVEEDFSAHRQRFLTEQGYQYQIDIIHEKELKQASELLLK